jgi:hypothetical protein
MTRDMGFFEEAKAGKSAGIGELMPCRVANGVKVHSFDQEIEEGAEARGIG